jgi:uncharacterized membrane protein (UPF0127 family)
MDDRPLPRLPRTTLPGGHVLMTAATLRSRLIGLTALRSLPDDHGLLLPRCGSVHTLGMAFALDLIWLDTSGRPLRHDRHVARRRLRTCPWAYGVVEVTAGAGARWSAVLAHVAGMGAPGI